MTKLASSVAVLAVFIGSLAGAAELRSSPYGGNAAAGRALALRACTGCHVVAPDQQFAPLLRDAPDFRAIANRPGTTAAQLQRSLTGLPQVPPHGQMANPLLSNAERADVAAYIMSLRSQ